MFSCNIFGSVHHGKRIGKMKNTMSAVLCKRTAESFQVRGLMMNKFKV
jgi:hypothetical protein